MASRIYYLRDDKNRIKRPNGSYTRGNPRVCIISDYDPTTHLVKYGVATFHSSERSLNKSFARTIAAWYLEHKAKQARVEAADKNQEPSSLEIHKAIMLRLRHHCNGEVKKLSQRWLNRASKDLKKAEMGALVSSSKAQEAPQEGTKTGGIQSDLQTKTGPFLRLVEEVDSAPDTTEMAIRA